MLANESSLNLPGLLLSGPSALDPSPSSRALVKDTLQRVAAAGMLTRGFFHVGKQAARVALDCSVVGVAPANRYQFNGDTMGSILGLVSAGSDWC